MASRTVDPRLARLAGWLSERAMATLAELSAVRDATRTESRQPLIKRLRELGMPVSSAVLELEEAIGGVRYASVQLGVAAALRRDGSPMKAWRGEPLAPMRVPADDDDAGDLLYVDAAGRIYLGDDVAEGGVLAERWSTWLERDLLWRRDRGAAAADLCAVTTTLLVGEQLAAAVHATPVGPASDRYARTWLGDTAEVVERAALLDYWSAGTTVVSSRLDEVVGALFALAAHDPGAPVCWTPPRASRPATAQQPEVVVRLPRLDEHAGRVRGEVWVTGQPGRWAIVVR